MIATLAAAEMLAPDRPDGMTELRDHLVAMQADVGAAIEAVDRVPIEAERSGRAVVADDGERILLTFYSEAGVVAAVELGPVRAVALAGRLLEAASARLRP
jgi:hypothetical protein